MKKIYLFLGLALAGKAGMAQQIEIIPKVGINMSKQNIGDLSGEKNRTAIQGGVAVNIAAGSRFSIQPELNFIQKGTKIKNGTLDETRKLNYLELPVLAKYSVGPVYLNAGPSIGLLLGQNDKTKKQYGETLKKLDIGLQLGAGLALPAGPGKLIVDARYAMGLTNIGKLHSVKNKGIQVSLGYAIPLK